MVLAICHWIRVCHGDKLPQRPTICNIYRSQLYPGKGRSGAPNVPNILALPKSVLGTFGGPLLP